MIRVLALLTACGGPAPVVDGVAPAEAWPGEAVQISGAELGPDLEVMLVAGERRVPLPFDDVTPTLLRTELPADLPPARWTVEVRRGRRTVQGGPIDVWTPDAEPPCAKRYALDVDISRELRRVVVQRLFEDRESTREVFVGDQLTALAWERRPLADGRRCEAVWLLDGVGRKWLIADDTERDLVAVAEHLGHVLGVPVAPLHGVTAAGAR